MVFVFLALWTISVILLLNDPYKNSARWAALLAFCGGCGGFASAVVEHFAPYLKAHHLVFPTLDETALVLYNFGSFVHTNGLPYAYLMFAIARSDLFSHNARRWMAGAGLIPVVYMLCVTPFDSGVQHDYRLITLWAGPYILAGTGLLLYGWLRERNPRERRERLIAVVMAVPPVMSQLAWHYVLRLFGYSDVWRLNTLTVAAMIVAFIVFAARYDMFGINRREERHDCRRRLDAMASGALFLNHAIKDEALKIRACSQSLREACRRMEAGEDYACWLDQLDVSSGHLLGIASRVSRHMQFFELREDEHELSGIIGDAVRLVEPYLRESGAAVDIGDLPEAALLCDRVHMVETFKNLFMNAIEAGCSKIRIDAVNSRQGVALWVADDGDGIPADRLPHIFDPFRSTKPNRLNMGLGLYYCRNVMRQHGGSIELESKPNAGTTAILRLPKNRVVRFAVPCRDGGSAGLEQLASGEPV